MIQNLNKHLNYYSTVLKITTLLANWNSQVVKTSVFGQLIVKISVFWQSFQKLVCVKYLEV